MEPYQVTLVIAIAFACIEVVTSTFIFIGFTLASMVVALLQYFFNDYAWGRDIVVFSIFSVLFILSFRKIFKTKQDSKSALDDEDVNRY
jgi:membrane protein implicated in regulation of membrane protease activity